MVLLVGLVIATLLPLAFLYTIYKLDLYASSTFRVIAACFGWGVISVGFAYLLNNFLAASGWLAEANVVTVGAPVIEELLKAVILLYLVRRPRFTYFVDGAVYGFAAGIGFAIAENYFFIFSNPAAAVNLAVARVLSTNLIHASASSIVGIALALSRFEKKPQDRGVLVIGGLLLPIILHSIFNSVVTRLENQLGLLLIFSLAVAFGGLAVIVMAIRYGLGEQKRWIQEKLGDADRVTQEEAAVVHRLAEAATVLAPLVNQFGGEKGAQLGHLLVLQAQLGILRKTLEKLPDEKTRRQTEERIAALRIEMDATRQTVGFYAMLGLRNLVPKEDKNTWGRLEQVMEKRDGGDFFSSVDLLTLSLTTLQRKIMFVLLRETDPLSLPELKQALREQNIDNLSERELQRDLAGLMERSWVVQNDHTPPAFRVRLGPSKRRASGWGIWAALDEPAAVEDPVYARTIWRELTFKLNERATAVPTPKATLWLDLEKRVRPGESNQ